MQLWLWWGSFVDGLAWSPNQVLTVALIGIVLWCWSGLGWGLLVVAGVWGCVLVENCTVDASILFF